MSIDVNNGLTFTYTSKTLTYGSISGKNEQSFVQKYVSLTIWIINSIAGVIELV